MEHQEIVEQAFSILSLQIVCLFQDGVFPQNAYKEAVFAGLITNQHFLVLSDSYTPEETLLISLSSNQITQLLKDGFLQRVGANLSKLLETAANEGNSEIVQYLLRTSTFDQYILDETVKRVSGFCTCEDVDLCIQMGAVLDYSLGLSYNGEADDDMFYDDSPELAGTTGNLGIRPLSYACLHDNVSVAQHLVETYYNQIEETYEPLWKDIITEVLTYTYHNKALAQWFIEKCNVSQFGLNNLLVNSANNPELIKYLVENFTFSKCFIDLSFERAYKNKNVRSMETLFKNGGNISVQQVLSSQFHNEENVFCEEYKKCLAFLRENLNLVDTVLIYGNTEIVEFFLNKGLLIGNDTLVDTPLIYGRIKIAKLLFDKGLPISNKSLLKVIEGVNPLETIDFLMQRKIFLKEVKNRALEKASHLGLDSVCEKLLGYGAGFSLKHLYSINSW